MGNALLLASIFIPLLGSIAVFVWGRKSKETVSIFSTAIIGIILVDVITMYVMSAKGSAISVSYDVGAIVKLALRADALNLFLALIASTVTFCVAFYCIDFIKEKKGLYSTFLLLALYGMMGVIFSKNLFTLLLFFELFSIASSALVVHEQTKQAVRAAFQYLFISVVGTACLILGTVILYSYTGSLDLTGAGIANISKGPGILVFWLLITGFGVKAGMFPAHIWLPESYPVAPPPASAVLSGVMAKVGAYGIIRVVLGVFGSQSAIGVISSNILIILAVVTMIGGSVAAITQTELKKMLAYSSVAQIGYVILGAALLNPIALAGAVLHIFNHALMKSSLFMATGSFIKETGTSEIKNLKGIGKKMPLTMTIFTLSAISMIGIPPFIGFFSKWLLGAGAMNAVKLGIISPWASYVIIGMIVLSGLLNAIYFGPIIINGWFGLPADRHSGAETNKSHSHQDEEVKPKIKLTEPSWVMIAPMFILSASTLVMGILVRYPLQLVTSVVKLYFRS